MAVANIIPTIVAFIPSKDLYTIVRFLKLLQIGNKKKIINTLGKKIAIVPITHPNS